MHEKLSAGYLLCMLYSRGPLFVCDAGASFQLKRFLSWMVDVQIGVAMEIHALFIEEVHIDGEDPSQDIAHHGNSKGNMSITVSLQDKSNQSMALTGRVESGPVLTTTAPIIGGKTVPPEIAATRSEPPRFV